MNDHKPDKEQWPMLMQAAQNGDSKAYHRLLSEIEPVLRQFLYRRIFDQNSIEDVLQEILMAVHKARHSFRADQPFENWMYGVARFKVIDFIRKTKKIQSNEFSSDEFETFMSAPPNNVDEDWSEDLNRALEQLPQKQRRILVMTKIEGHTLAEVAKELGISESAAKVSAHRAYKRLKDWLVAYGY